MEHKGQNEPQSSQGGGQKTLATAGGQDSSNLQKVIDTIKNLIK